MLSLPANIRVNASFPFPALVVGAGAIAITKQNGIWTVSFNAGALGISIPNVSQLSTDYVVVYDSVAKQNVRVPLSAFNVASALPQRSVTATPIIVAANDQIINYNVNSAVTCTLPSYTTRSGAPLIFKDAGGHQSGTNTLTITPAGGETIDGQASLVLSTPRQRIILTPYNDGTNTGWST